jgi:hypothetical protein
MRSYFLKIILVLLSCCLLSVAFPQGLQQTRAIQSEDPAKLFAHPPESAKPGVLWMWMGSNISREGITKDLEALKAEGFNRTTMFSLADITTPWAGKIDKSPTPEIISWTEPWWKLVRYAAEESKRLGMDFGMYNGAGYEASGGVWITPELSMQELCWSQTKVSGSNQVDVNLERPKVPLKGHTPFPIYDGHTGKVDIPEVAARATYYRDVAVLALPANGVVAKNDIINLTSKMQPDGHLNWKAPAGEWIIYRFGHTTSGTLIQPAQWEATGLECDKMDPDAIAFHMDYMIGEIQKHLGDLIGSGFTHLHFDSYEAGTPTWTPKMREEFAARRAYDMTPYLAIFAGRCINDKQDSLKFRNDFNATIKDLYRDVYFTTIAKKLKAANLTFLCEPYGGPWRQDEIMPLIPNVMTEFWTNGGKYRPVELEATVAALRKSGQNIVEAEAFTGQPEDSKWDETPAWLKPIGDAAFCAGVNRLVLHRFVEQPFDDRYKPGATMGRWGTHFDRTQTWWKPAKAMVEYWQRCQALLQWGTIAPKIESDFTAANITGDIVIQNIHRQLGKTNIYFVANISRKAGTATCSFKVTGMQPEVWNPVTGTMRTLSDFKEENGMVSIQMQFDTAQSFFIFFGSNKTQQSSKKQTNFPSYKALATIEGNWQVQFDAGWGGPQKPVPFKTLTDWTTSTNPGIKYFSGTVVYRNVFDKPSAAPKRTPLFLDLGAVKHIAKIKVNNKEVGIVWTAPWRIEIPLEVLKPRNNQLEIEVTNVWANRLIGDEQEPDDCKWIPGYISGGYSLKEFPDWFLQKRERPSKGRFCFTSWKYFTKDSPLISSGLLGPVRLMQQEE